EFFEKGTLPVEHVVDGLNAAIRELRIFPVLCSSALHNVGTDRVMDFIVETFPSPVEHAAVEAKLNGQTLNRVISANEQASDFVFKTTADPFAGRITFFKVMSGCIKNDQHLIDVQKSTDERLAHLGSPLGKTIQPVNELHAGDIGAVAKLKDALTGHT